jgi:hypothetical protein
VALGSWDGGWAWLEGLESKQRSGKLRVGWSTLQGPWGKKVPWFKWARLWHWGGACSEELEYRA